MGRKYNSMSLILYIDSAKKNLKYVLLDKYGIERSVPIGYGVNVPETYESLKITLSLIDYNKPTHNWFTLGDFKIINILVGLMAGYPSNPCPLCLFNSRPRKLANGTIENQYHASPYPLRIVWMPGSQSVANLPLISPNKILFPAFHIKLGLFASFIRSLGLKNLGEEVVDSRQEIAKHLRTQHHFTLEQLESGSVEGPRVINVQKDLKFLELLPPKHQVAFKAFNHLSEGLFGILRADDLHIRVEAFLKSFEEIGVSISLKIHFIRDHLDRFPSVETCSDQHGERFHQELAFLEQRFQSWRVIGMLSDYAWFASNEGENSSPASQSSSLTDSGMPILRITFD